MTQWIRALLHYHPTPDSAARMLVHFEAERHNKPQFPVQWLEFTDEDFDDGITFHRVKVDEEYYNVLKSSKYRTFRHEIHWESSMFVVWDEQKKETVQFKMTYM